MQLWYLVSRLRDSITQTWVDPKVAQVQFPVTELCQSGKDWPKPGVEPGPLQHPKARISLQPQLPHPNLLPKTTYNNFWGVTKEDDLIKNNTNKT